MKILITGSQGYLARNLSKKLSEHKIICYGIGRGNWKKNYYKKWGFHNNVSGNINDRTLSKFKKIKFNYIIHLAGGASPTTNLIKSISKKKDYQNNFLTTHSILKYILSKNNESKLIFMSTIAVLGNNKSKKLKENHKTKPISNYAKNKFLAEKLCHTYNKKFNIDVLIIRGTSIFGPGLKRQIIHDVCYKLVRKQNIFYGSGEEIRDFLYISDICDLFKNIINIGFEGFNILNVGTGKGTKIKKIIKYLNNKLGKKIVPKFNGIGSNINPKRLVPDIRNTKKFKWKPKINLYKGLNIYLKWFLKYNKND